MKKPEEVAITVSNYDYYDCATYIAHKLGLKDLESFGDNEDNSGCFSRLVEDMSEISNIEMSNCVYISAEYPSPNWAKPVIKAFHEEFGEYTEYWYEV